MAVEASLQGLQNQTVERTGVWQLPVGNTSSNVLSQQKVSARTPSRDYLLPPSTSSTRQGQIVPKSSQAMLSPPTSMTTRSAWDKVSDLDKAKQLSLSQPVDLNEVTFSGASRDALARFGTTPEKLKESLGVTKLGGSPRPPSRQRSGNKDARVERSSEKKSSSAADFPPLPDKAPTNPFARKPSGGGGDAAKKVDGSSFPPMSKITPKPLPTATDQSLKAPSIPSMSVKDALSTASKGFGDALSGSDKKSGDGAPKSAFNMAGLGGSSLFGSDGSKTPTKPGAQGFPGAGPAPAPGTSEPDYRMLLTDFYAKVNPAKVGDVDKHLDKYKVSKRERVSLVCAQKCSFLCGGI